MDIKNQIDDELRNITLPKDFGERILYGKKQQKKFQYRIAVVMLCLILGGSTVYAAYTVYNKIHVNKMTIPDLQPMEKKTVKVLRVSPNELGEYEKSYKNFRELYSELGIKLLTSGFAENNTFMHINRSTDNENWDVIQITAYILGDIKELKEVKGEKFYSWEEGSEFGSPVDMTIDIILSEEQLKTGWPKDYLGTYEYVETFWSRQGYKANILADNAVPEKDRYEGYKPKCYGIFVADGIRYTLSGHVTTDKMKEIINSME